MSRNVTILVIILVIVLIAGYLVWLRGKFQAPEVVTTPVPSIEVVVENSPSPTPTSVVATPSATITPKPSAKVATPAATVKPATKSGTTR